MATNGFGSIYSKSYWGVTDSENGFGNVYKDLAGYPTILLNFTMFLSGGRFNIDVYLTNPIVENLTDDIAVKYTIAYLDYYNNVVSRTRNITIELPRQQLIQSNNNLQISSFYKTFNPNIVSLKIEEYVLFQNGEEIPNPFEVDGINYLVKLTP